MLDSSGAFGAGRSSGEPDISALARVHGVACIERLVQILDGPDATAAVEAARLLLDRGFGRPLQQIAFGTDGVHVELNTSADADPHTRPDGEGHAWAGD